MRKAKSSLPVTVFAVLGLILAACSGAPSPPAAATAPGASATAVMATVYRSPTCSCCHEHEEYMRAGGIEVQSVVDPDVTAVKERYGVPPEMYSCHTTHIDGYFIEGHVPLEAISRLLAERPLLDGIALPGMPPGSPGMGGTQQGPLTIYGIRDGEVVEVFGDY